MVVRHQRPADFLRVDKERGQTPGSPAAGRDGPATIALPVSAETWDAPGAPSRRPGHPAAKAAAVSHPETEYAKGKLDAPKTATGPSGTRIER